jgi:predicted Holliday junction resolvase-like endonuclease
MIELPFFLRENRHIFSVCPKCGIVHRLSELRLSRKGRYASDWLDTLQSKNERWQNRKDKLESECHSLQQDAKEKAERKELPKLLNRVAPVFIQWKIDPRDVRTIFDPVEFVAFEGLNSEDGVQRVSLLHLGSPHRLTKSLEHTITAGNFGWNTLRLEDDGTITESIKPFHFPPL